MLNRRAIQLVCLALLLLLVMACTADENNEDTNNDATTTVTPTDTSISELTLDDPGPDAVLTSVNDGYWLSWSYAYELAENEYFDVRLWPEGEAARGLTWTKDDIFNLSDWLMMAEPGAYQWSVAVIEGRIEDGRGVLERELLSSPTYRLEVGDDIRNVVDFLELPPGFAGKVYAFGPTDPTAITFGPDGHLYAAALNGDIFRLVDNDGDDYAEMRQPIFRSNGQLRFLAGITFDDNGTLFVSDSGRIGTLIDENSDDIYDTHTVLVEGLPSWLYWGHSNNGIAFGPDGKLYVGVGSTTDHGLLREEYEASMLRMNPDGSELEVFATGFRNPYDLAFSPEGELFAIDNNPDQFDAGLPYLPAEELNHVREGLDYGFPDVFAPPLNGYGDTEPPAALFLASVGSSGMTYYRNNAFSEDFNDGLFVAQWGGNQDLRLLPNGYRVVYVDLQPDTGGETFSGEWTSFAAFDRENTLARPVDVTAGPDGTLYIVEYQTGVILRIEYVGETETEAPSPEAELIALGRSLYENGVEGGPSCAACHANVAVAPLMQNVGALAATRRPGMEAESYLYESILLPNAYIVEGYNAGAMFQGYGDVLSQEELDALVAYMLTLRE